MALLQKKDCLPGHWGGNASRMGRPIALMQAGARQFQPWDWVRMTLVRKARLELARVAPLEPKSSASTNSATLARLKLQGL